jgi:hypothetical protein
MIVRQVGENRHYAQDPMTGVLSVNAGRPTHRAPCDEWYSVTDDHRRAPDFFHHKRRVHPSQTIQPDESDNVPDVSQPRCANSIQGHRRPRKDEDNRQ